MNTQMLKTERPTRNDLPEESRSAMVELLNANLANALDLTLQTKQAHWNVKGPGFFQLHELFDKVYGEAAGWSDTIAERAVQLGGTADGSLQGIAKRSHLPRVDVTLRAGEDHVEAVASALADFGKSVRSAIDKAAGAGDQGTADLFTEVSRGSDMMLWFVEAHLQAER